MADNSTILQSLIADIYHTIDVQDYWECVCQKINSLIGCNEIRISYFNELTGSDYKIDHLNQEIRIERQIRHDQIPHDSHGIDKFFESDEPSMQQCNKYVSNNRYKISYTRTPFKCSINSELKKLSSEDSLFLETLLPHLCRALRLDEKRLILHRREMLHTVFCNQRNLAVAIINCDWEIIDSNDEFSKLIHENSDIFKFKKNRLSLASQNKKFQEYLKMYFDKNQPNEEKQDFVFPYGPTNKRQYQLYCDPINYAFFKGKFCKPQRCLRLSILPALSARDHHENIASLFDLTDTQTELVCLLCEGKTAQEIAAIRTKSTHTIRTQIKTVLKKTGFNRQPELIANILNMCLVGSFIKNNTE